MVMPWEAIVDKGTAHRGKEGLDRKEKGRGNCMGVIQVDVSQHHYRRAQINNVSKSND
jgi:hypothetical protein